MQSQHRQERRPKRRRHAPPVLSRGVISATSPGHLASTVAQKCNPDIGNVRTNMHQNDIELTSEQLRTDIGTGWTNRHRTDIGPTSETASELQRSNECYRTDI